MHVRSRAFRYLSSKDFWRIQEWNNEMFQNHNQLINKKTIIEYEKRRKFYKLASFISKSPTKMTCEGFTHYLHYLRLNETIGAGYTMQDIAFMEKIALKIALSGIYWHHEKLIVNAFVNHLKLPSVGRIYARCRPLLIMQEMMQGTVRLDRLEQIFEIGLREVTATGYKYNRYIRFAFHQMNVWSSRHNLVSSSIADYFQALQKLWSTVDTVFITKFLMQRDPNARLVCSHNGPRHCFRILMIAAINSTDLGNAINEEPLKLLAAYRHVFTVDLVVKYLLIDYHELQTIIKVIKWMVDQELASWGKIHGILLKIRRLHYPLIDQVMHRELCKYVKTQMNLIEHLNGNTAKKNPLERRFSRGKDPNDDRSTGNCCVLQ